MRTIGTKSATKARPAASTAPADAAKIQFPLKTVEDIAALGKSNVDALIQAGATAMHGWEELTRSFVGLTQSQVEAGMTAAKALLGARTLAEFSDLQKTYSRTAFDNAVSEASRLSEIGIRIASETIEPLSARMTATIEHLSKPAIAA